MKNTDMQTVAEDLLSLLDSFKETALVKQRALIEHNMESLEKCISKEEGLLFQVQSLFKRRNSAVNKYSKNQSNFNNVLNDDADTSQKELFQMLKKERELITSKVKAINLINEQNKYLTEQARGFVRSLVGEIVNKQNNKIVDMKV